MTQKEKKLLLNIARNPEPQKIFDNMKKGDMTSDEDSPYYQIVKWQFEKFNEKFKWKRNIFMHLPEPWNGHLSKAKIMFISSNPSFSVEESFPNCESKDEEICCFFDNRFANLAEDKEIITKYWKSIAKYTSWIIPGAENKSFKDILNEYVVCTEVVHCKSQSEIGVKKIFNNATSRETEMNFLKEILSLYNGEIIILVGKYIKNIKGEICKDARISEKKIITIKGPTYPQSDKARKISITNQLRKQNKRKKYRFFIKNKNMFL